MEYYPILAGAGGGAQPLLLGMASIVRTADTYMASGAYRDLLKNCQYEAVAGDAGVLDSATGLITMPAGAKIVRLNIHQDTSGSSGGLYLRVRWGSEGDGEVFHNIGSGNIATANMVRGIANGETEVSPVIYFSTSHTLDATMPMKRYIGSVEFFG